MQKRPHRVTKTYGNEEGLSCVFRQWRAKSHCRYLHGYALGVEIQFGAGELDEHGWVIDFGDLDEIKSWLHSYFDHTLIVASDDPLLATFRELNIAGVADIRSFPGVGCEAFAQYILEWVHKWLEIRKLRPRVQVMSVRVFEHGANSAQVVQYVD